MWSERLRALEHDSLGMIEAACSLEQPACVTCSFQSSGMVLLHMLRRRHPDVPVLFLDTLHHFPETLAYRDRMAEAWRLNLITLRADQPSIGLWQQDLDGCCRRHKAEPLFAALESYAIWFSGLRRDQSSSRANLQEVAPFTLPSGTTLTKVSPLARWTTKDVWYYAKAHEIPLLSLYDEGYTSIGCQPCTTPPIDPSNLRSGRWQGQKVECGLHVEHTRESLVVSR
jgi:phosphoadenosine phosphosulfate reductase